MEKITSIKARNLREGMVLATGNDRLYVIEVEDRNDDLVLIRGSYAGPNEYPSATMVFPDYETVKIVV